MAKHQTDLDLVFLALGDPTRRAILERLAAGPLSVTELARPFAMALPSFMKHIGMISSDKDGRVRTCALVPGALAPARDWLAAQKHLWEARLDRFDAFVTQLAKDPNA